MSDSILQRGFVLYFRTSLFLSGQDRLPRFTRTPYTVACTKNIYKMSIQINVRVEWY